MFLAASNLPTAELLTDLVWVFTVGTLVIALLHRRKLPSLLGFLLTGLIVGPAGLGLVEGREAIEVMAELGIVLLMFTIGLEVSLRDLARMWRSVLGGGLLQIGLTTACIAGIGIAAGLAPMTAVALGLIGSASSTALVLRLLGDRGELRTTYGQLSLAILLMQDFAVVVLMLVLPMMAAGAIAPLELGMALGRAMLIGGGIVLGAKFVFPWVLRKVVNLRSREVFLLTSVVAVFGTAWIADAAGLSLAIGAFLAGLVISESDYSHQMLAEVLPFRDLLNGLFFVSVGLLVSRDIVIDNAGLLGALVVGTLFVKASVVVIAAKALRLDTRSALIAAVALSQVGEFALVLAQQASLLGLISGHDHSMLIAVSVLTMAITPLALPAANRRFGQLTSPIPAPEDVDPLDDHVIIVGYGLNGRNVARALRQLHVKFVVVEMNPATVATNRLDGLPIVYGDATRPALLEHMHVQKARALVCCIADAAATRDVVAVARHANPEMLIIARSRYVAEIAPLMALGASSVVPEEFETSLELIARVMRAYGASEGSIHREKHILRSAQYLALLDGPPSDAPDIAAVLDSLDVVQIEVFADTLGCGQTLGELDLRRTTGATAIAVLRDDETHAAPAAEFLIEAGDVFVLVGDTEAIHRATDVLQAKRRDGSTL